MNCPITLVPVVFAAPLLHLCCTFASASVSISPSCATVSVLGSLGTKSKPPVLSHGDPAITTLTDAVCGHHDQLPRLSSQRFQKRSAVVAVLASQESGKNMTWEASKCVPRNSLAGQSCWHSSDDLLGSWLG
ncbi:hypothetical protein BD289DRAFT_446748, partial [Coniella lustricola]